MSASLVGSEMCIRDRAEASAVAQACRPCRWSAETQSRRPRPAWLQRTAAVSYTHLTLPTICSV
eukprot:15273198-Alexandrium_andersonii.AAC.1